jgi:hypothetical protein
MVKPLNPLPKLCRRLRLMIDTKDEVDADEPAVDVCYISDLLVNLISGDSQQIGILHNPTKLTFADEGGEFIPWSFELFSLGLDILLPKMTPESFRVRPRRNPHEARVDTGLGPCTGDAFLPLDATDVRTSHFSNLEVPTRPTRIGPRRSDILHPTFPS